MVGSDILIYSWFETTAIGRQLCLVYIVICLQVSSKTFGIILPQKFDYFLSVIPFILRLALHPLFRLFVFLSMFY
jgi:hypothetical protein